MASRRGSHGQEQCRGRGSLKLYISFLSGMECFQVLFVFIIDVTRQQIKRDYWTESNRHSKVKINGFTLVCQNIRKKQSCIIREKAAGTAKKKGGITFIE